MAKFEIVVCILLVVSGTQGGLLSSIANTATSVLTSVISNATAQATTVQATVDSLANTTADVTNAVTSAVSDATTEYTETVASIVASVTSVVDVTSCLSLSADFEEVANGIGDTAIAAVNDLQNSLEAKYTIILADLQNLISIATNYLEELDSCLSNIKSFLSCIALSNSIPSVMSLISTVWTTISVDITALGDEFELFTSSLSSLNIVTAVANLKSATETSIAEVKECVTALTKLS